MTIEIERMGSTGMSSAHGHHDALPPGAYSPSGFFQLLMPDHTAYEERRLAEFTRRDVVHKFQLWLDAANAADFLQRLAISGGGVIYDDQERPVSFRGAYENHLIDFLRAKAFWGTGVLRLLRQNRFRFANGTELYVQRDSKFVTPYYATSLGGERYILTFTLPARSSRGRRLELDAFYAMVQGAVREQLADTGRVRPYLTLVPATVPHIRDAMEEMARYWRPDPTRKGVLHLLKDRRELPTGEIGFLRGVHNMWVGLADQVTGAPTLVLAVPEPVFYEQPHQGVALRGQMFLERGGPHGESLNRTRWVVTSRDGKPRQELWESAQAFVTAIFKGAHELVTGGTPGRDPSGYAPLCPAARVVPPGTGEEPEGTWARRGYGLAEGFYISLSNIRRAFGDALPVLLDTTDPVLTWLRTHEAVERTDRRIDDRLANHVGVEFILGDDRRINKIDIVFSRAWARGGVSSPQTPQVDFLQKWSGVPNAADRRIVWSREARKEELPYEFQWKLGSHYSPEGYSDVVRAIFTDEVRHVFEWEGGGAPTVPAAPELLDPTTICTSGLLVLGGVGIAESLGSHTLPFFTTLSTYFAMF